MLNIHQNKGKFQEKIMDVANNILRDSNEISCFVLSLIYTN